MTSSYLSPSSAAVSPLTIYQDVAVLKGSHHCHPDISDNMSCDSQPWRRPLGNSLDPISLDHTDCTIQRQISLAKLTSLKVGGAASLYVTPRNSFDLQSCLGWANDHGEPVTFLGAGSNLLISDRGLSGLIVSTRYLRHSFFDEDCCQLTVGAGEPIARLAWKAAEKGWSGLEWAAGIPGTVGGAVVMNAGAHKLCTADVLVNTEVLSSSNECQTLANQNLGFEYRTSLLQNSSLLVTQATFQLEPGYSPAAIMAKTRAFLDYRHKTQPYNMPNCGSVFRNHPSHSAGWLIEHTGLKGHQIGDAQVSPLHANFIVNLGHATAQDIYSLIGHIQTKVEQKWALHLHPEVKFMGQF